MLEILFTDSAAGGLKYASSFGKGPYRSKTVHVFIPNDGTALSEQEKEMHIKELDAKEKASWEKAVPMDIGSEAVVSLSFGIATGDISEDYPAEKRLEYFEKLMAIYPDFRKEDTDELFGRIQRSLDRVLDAAKANQPLRLWYSDNPDELCGMYHLIYLIEKINPDCEIYTVKLPSDYIREDGTIIRYNGWGGVPPEEWHLHFKPEKANKAFITMCAGQWRRLKADNAHVRAMLNGVLHSMPADIYDSFIIKEIQAMDIQFRQAVVIGNVLGKYQLCVGDAFISNRIEEMIQKGVLTIVEQAAPGMPLYHRILKKNM